MRPKTGYLLPWMTRAIPLTVFVLGLQAHGPDARLMSELFANRVSRRIE